jgi:predicted Holliday junction resolvase-like endonuclease
MIDASTAYILLAMVMFILVAMIVTHYHNCSDLVQRTRNQVEALERQLEEKSLILAAQAKEFRAKIEKLDTELAVFKENQE